MQESAKECKKKTVEPSSEAISASFIWKIEDKGCQNSHLHLLQDFKRLSCALCHCVASKRASALFVYLNISL